MEGAYVLRRIAVPHGGRHGEEVRTGLDQRRAIGRRDPADRDAGDLDHRLPPFKQLQIGPVLAVFGGAGEEAAERDVVGTRLARFEREVAARVAGDANLRLPPELIARVPHVTVALAQVDPVGPQSLGQANAVVDDEGAVVRTADLLQRRGECCGGVLIDALHAELESRDVAGGQRLLKLSWERAANFERRDQVQLALRKLACVLVGMPAHSSSLAAPVRIGCSGWMYKHWRGLFYPQALPVKRWFAHYAETFDTVEINNSFYHLPPPSTFAGWREQAPAGFRYAIKANRFLTQAKKLKDCEEPLVRMMDSVWPLGEALGPMLYQLPPRFKVNLERLESFLTLLPADVTSVFEFREPTWYCDEVFALLDRYGASFCVHDMPGLTSPRLAVGPIAYVRFHGGEGKYWGRYADESLLSWTDWIVAEARNGRPVWAYFNNDIDAHAIHDALTLRAMISQALPRSVQTRESQMAANLSA